MHLTVIGINHKTSPIEVREKFSISKETILQGLQNIKQYNGLSEAVILSTCNRTEVYAVQSGVDSSYSVKQFLFDLIGCSNDIDEYLYTFNDVECTRHLFEVASSLDSLILGEGQILSQVKAAYTMAKDVSATSTILNTLFNRAIATGKIVRTETKIAYNSVSVSYAAVELAKRSLNGLNGKCALIFGAGKMAQLTAQHLISHGIDKIFIANRHIERAEELALKVGGEAIAWSKALSGTVDVDVIVTSTGAPHYVVKAQQTYDLMQQRGGRKLFIIDIAVPRDVEPEVGNIEGVTLFNIDDLESVVDAHVKQRQEEAKLAQKIVDDNVNLLVERFKYLSFQPLMASLSQQAEQVRLREIHRVSSKLPNLTVEEQRVIDNMTKMIVRKLLRLPMMNLNSSAGTSDEKFYVDAVKSLFFDSRAYR
ncbi:MAG: glutamyl-tRNA reductase [Selenomonadaceae bacterium]|nr:glutamyl-tRNA reductase [Selenomonadaceae bacterium]